MYILVNTFIHNYSMGHFTNNFVRTYKIKMSTRAVYYFLLETISYKQYGIKTISLYLGMLDKDCFPFFRNYSFLK